ncbi:MAG TPA: hypothetical protein VFG35_00765 [Actinoplanes sp.]|nr:hypothetical protein [Actinoplanes sp.]
MLRVLALITALLLTGCGTPEQAVTPAPTASSMSVSASVDDPPGSLTCTALAATIADGTLMTPGVVDDVVRAGTTADAPVADAAERLAAAYAAAISAAGSEQEPDAVAAVVAAASDMSSVCSDSGLRTVG